MISRGEISCMFYRIIVSQQFDDVHSAAETCCSDHSSCPFWKLSKEVPDSIRKVQAKV